MVVVMLPVMLAILALAGAPASTHVECNPGLATSAELGVTFPDTITVLPNGTIVPGRLTHVQLGPLACGAILYLSAAPADRAAIRKLNPNVNFFWLVGVGLQVALHEANHVALNSTNECLVEKTTRVQINTLIGMYADPGQAKQAETDATASDQALPAQYHGC